MDEPLIDSNWEEFVTELEDEDDCDAAFRYGEGPPVQSLAWPTPTLFPARLVVVNAYDHRSSAVRTLDNVLINVHSPDTAYLIRKKIAKTTFGTVRCCVVLKRRSRDAPNFREVPWTSTEELVAIKISSWNKIRQNNGKHLQDPVREVAALQLIGNQYEHILGCHQVLEDDRNIYTIMPYYSQGSNLHGRLFSDPENSGDTSTGLPPPSEEEARSIFRQLLKGLLQLQRKGVVHRDISLDNILISKTNRVKIVDLGMSMRVPYSDAINHGCITDVSEGGIRRLIKKQPKGKRLMYLAPEVIAQKEAFDGYAVDLWAAGVILFVLCVGLAPFKQAHPSDKRYAKISSGGLKNLTKTLKLSLSDEACDLIQHMLREDPQHRLSLLEVMKHPWVTGEKMPIHERAVETSISCDVSEASVSSTEPTEEKEPTADTDGVHPLLKTATPSPLLADPESRQSPSETRDSFSGTMNQGKQRLARNFQQLGPKLKTNAQQMATNAQRIGPKLMKSAMAKANLPRPRATMPNPSTRKPEERRLSSPDNTKPLPTRGTNATVNKLRSVTPTNKPP
jgi:serine/threonine protein kinase